jgi:protein phosphatase
MASFLSRIRNNIMGSRQDSGVAIVESAPNAGKRHAVVSDTGRVQDCILTQPENGLWIVADGMGGHSGGAEASRIACEAVAEAVAHGMELADAFEVAHARVRADQEQHPDYYDMGTTLVAVRESGAGYELAWVGDSRAYRVGAESVRLECLTRDQNVAGRLLQAGSITAEEARSHPQRNILTDCIGQREGLPTIEVVQHEWRPGDRLLLCTDGLSGELTDAELEHWLTQLETPAEAAAKLLELALDAGGRDNVSMVLIDAR